MSFDYFCAGFSWGFKTLNCSLKLRYSLTASIIHCFIADTSITSSYVGFTFFFTASVSDRNTSGHVSRFRLFGLT
jgi:hypothetical protein